MTMTHKETTGLGLRFKVRVGCRYS